MKSIRLNNEIREQILDNIKAAYLKVNPLYKRPPNNLSFSQQTAEIAKAEHLQEVAMLSALIQEHPDLKILKLLSLSDNCTRVGKVLLPENNVSVEFDSPMPGVHQWVALRDWRDSKDQPRKIKTLLKNKAKIDRDYRKETEKVNESQKELERYLDKVRQPIYGVNTTGQLLEIWPEVSKYLPQGTINPSKINLPAINIKDLNTVLEGK